MKGTREKQHSFLPLMGKNLIKVREVFGMSQQELAEKLGFCKNSIHRFETNKQELSFYLLYYLWLMDEVNPMYLLKGEEPIFLFQEKEMPSELRTQKEEAKGEK